MKMRESQEAKRAIYLTPDASGISQFDRDIELSLSDPDLFAQCWLGIQLWGKQLEILRSLNKYDKTAVKACHASGKTFVAAVAVLWWLARYPNCRVVTTAPTDTQVRKLLWGEIAGLLASETNKLMFPKPNQVELSLGPHRLAIGYSTSVTNQNMGVRFQGWHEEHVLIIMDESPGVHPSIWDSIEGIRAGGDVSLLALGNPTINSGPFFDCFGTAAEGVNRITISAFDTPNLKGKTIQRLIEEKEASPELFAIKPRGYLKSLTSKQWVLDRYKALGEDHPSYQSRVLGNFPDHSDSSLFSLTWLEKARLRLESRSNRDADYSAGLDVAGPGEDETVICIRKGDHIVTLKGWSKEDPRGEVVAELNRFKGRLKAINVDSVSIGHYMYKHLSDIFGDSVVAVNVGTESKDKEKYFNLKAELYWALRMRLEAGEISGLTDDTAIAQLAGMRYNLNERGQTMIERKVDAQKRGVHSPDRAEAIMLAFARPMKPAAGLMEYYDQMLKEARAS